MPDEHGSSGGCLLTFGKTQPSACVSGGVIRTGPLSKDSLELDNLIANLELLPLRLNEEKYDKIGDRQVSYALHQVGLLSAEGLKKVQNTRRGQLLSGVTLSAVFLMLSVLFIGFQDLEDRCQPTGINMLVGGG